MRAYSRYVDDSNQIAQVKEGCTEEQTKKELLEIANSIEDGIEMELDTCENHEDHKLPILDMKVWIDSDGDAVYQHFEKPVSSKLVISSRSAHANSCKRSVHISELVRRMTNTSRKLDWNDHVAPILSEYMARMMKGGYSEDYRKHILLNALAIWDSKVRMDESGESPLNRPAGYKKNERRKQKQLKKKTWSTKGGYIAPIIIPSTPDGKLAKMLRKVAEEESENGIKFKIIEKGGLTMEKMLQKPNPTASGICGKENCVMDKQGSSDTMCHKSNVLYEWVCKKCGNKYVGETSRNFYTRSLEHIEKAEKKKDDSFINNHQREKHNDEQPDFCVKVLKTFNDPLSRQVYEGVHIRNNSAISLNSKLDYYQTSTYNMRREVLHG